MSAIISWFFFATKQNKSLFLICLRSGFCSSPGEEDDCDMLLNAVLSVWVFVSQNIFWIVIFNIWLIFHSVWAEKHRPAGQGAEGSQHSLTSVILCEVLQSKFSRAGVQPCQTGAWQLLTLKSREQIFLHRSPWQGDFTAILWHPNMYLGYTQRAARVPSGAVSLCRVRRGLLDRAEPRTFCYLLL